MILLQHLLAEVLVGTAILGGSIVPDSISMELMPFPSPSVEVASTKKSTSPTENYLPRRLYPGTYGEFCGPTPEIKVQQSCAIHGWHSDAPKDAVDLACQRHDVSYCQCETELLNRQTDNNQLDSSKLTLLPSLTALRFATKPVLLGSHTVDTEFFQCINRADRRLVSTGVQVRGEMQRSACSLDSSLTWFCNVDAGTLQAFEKVSLDIFLRDLDDDDNNIDPNILNRQQPTTASLKELERKRQLDLRTQLAQGKTLADAASSDSVQEDERTMVQRLQVDETDDGVTTQMMSAK